MEKGRTLPPLVRGRVTSVLDLFVDEIRLEETVLLLDNSDLVLQVQWWGEEFPTYIRPKKSCCQQQDIILRNSYLTEVYFHCARYEIKTTLDLFKSYLKTCEVLEICVLDIVENDIIGSAFLRDVINLFNKSNNIIVPIFDYSGKEIGEIVVHFSFLEKLEPHIQKIREVSYVSKHDVLNRKSDYQDCNFLNKAKENYLALAEKIIFYDRNFRRLSPDHRLTGDKCASEKNDDHKNDHVMNDVSLGQKEINPHEIKPTINNEYSCKCLPEVTTTYDSSKVLYFGVSQQQMRHKTDNKNFKTKVTNKFNSNSIKCKSKIANKLNVSSYNNAFSSGKQFLKKPENQAVSKNLPIKPIKVIKERQYEVFSSTDDCLHSEHPNNDQTLAQNITSKESFKPEVLDYLLGSDLSKEDEEKAVNEFKRLSPSHNLVTSINQLCLASENDFQKSESMNPLHLSEFPKQTCLNFNLNNPIERNYYEKFFFKSESPSPDLELAEFLNQPENSARLKKLKSEESICDKGSTKIDILKCREFPSCKRETTEKPREKDNFLEYFKNTGDRTNGCALCKYYKKLDELDTVIESLKNFEKKMQLQDKKDMKTAFTGSSNVLTKKRELNNSS